MARQKFDIGDLVEFDLGGQFQRGLILDKKTINPNYNTERTYHVDEYHCKILILNTEEGKQTSWVRAKWLKLLSKSS